MVEVAWEELKEGILRSAMEVVECQVNEVGDTKLPGGVRRCKIQLGQRR